MALSSATAFALAALATARVSFGTMLIVKANVALMSASVALVAPGRTGAVLVPRADGRASAVGGETAVGVLVVYLHGAAVGTRLLLFLGRRSARRRMSCTRGCSHDVMGRAARVHICNGRVARDELPKSLCFCQGEESGFFELLSPPVGLVHRRLEGVAPRASWSKRGGTTSSECCVVHGS